MKKKIIKHLFNGASVIACLSLFVCAFANTNAGMKDFKLTDAATAVNFSQDIKSNGLGSSLSNFASSGEYKTSGTTSSISMTNTNYFDGWVSSKQQYSITNGNSFVLQYHQQSNSATPTADYYRCFSPLAANESAAWANMLMLADSYNHLSFNSKSTEGCWDNFDRYVTDSIIRWVWNPDGSLDLYVCNGSDESQLSKYVPTLQAGNYLGKAGLFTYTTTGYLFLMGNSYQGTAVIDNVKFGQATSSSANPTWLVDSGNKPSDYFQVGSCTSASAKITDGVSDFITENPSTKTGVLYNKGILTSASNISLKINPTASTAGKAFGVVVGNSKAGAPFDGILAGISNKNGVGVLSLYDLKNDTELASVSLGGSIVGVENTLSVSFTEAGAITASYAGKSVNTTDTRVKDSYVGFGAYDYSGSGTFSSKIISFSINGQQTSLKTGRPFDEKFYGDASLFNIQKTNGAVVNINSSGIVVSTATNGSNIFTTGEYGEFDLKISFTIQGAWLGVCFGASTITAGCLWTAPYTLPFVNIGANGLEVWNHGTAGKNDGELIKDTCSGLASGKLGVLHIVSSSGTISYYVSVDGGTEVFAKSYSGVNTEGYIALTMTEGCAYTVKEFNIDNKQVTKQNPTNKTTVTELSVVAGESVGGTISGTSAYGSSICYRQGDNAALAGQANVSLNSTTGAFTIAANPNAIKGEYPFNYVIDDHGLIVEGSVTIKLAGTNIDHIELNTTKVKTRYKINEPIDVSFLTVRAYYANGSFKGVLPDNWSFEAEDGTSKVGTYSCKIFLKSDKDIFATYEYEVFETLPPDVLVIPSITNDSLSYKLGSKSEVTLEFDLHGCPLKEVRNDGVILIAGDDYSISEDNTSITFETSYLEKLNVGSQIISVTTIAGTASVVLNVVKGDLPVTSGEPKTASLNAKHVLETEYDLSIVYFMNGGTFAGIKIDGESVNEENYTFSNFTLTLKSQYLNNLSAGVHSLTFETNLGSCDSAINIENAARDVQLPTIENSYLTFTKGDSPDDLVIKFDLHDEQFDCITLNGVVVDEANYVSIEGGIKLLGSYLNTFNAGTYSFAVSSSGGTAAFIVAISNQVIDNPPVVISSNIKYGLGSGNDVNIDVDLKGLDIKYVAVNGFVLEQGSDYSYLDGVLTLKDSYLSDYNLGTYVFSLITEGGKSDFTVTVYNPYLPPKMDEQSFAFAHGTNQELSVLVNFEGLDLISLKDANDYVLVEESDYSLDANKIVFASSYLESLTAGTHSYSVTTIGGTCVFDIVVSYLKPVVTNDHLEASIFITENLALGENLYGLEAKEIKIGNTVLTANEHYVVVNDKIYIVSSYLNTLEIGDYQCFVTTFGGTANFYLKMFNPYSAPTFPGEDKVDFEYVKYNGSDFVKTIDLDGADFVSLKMGNKTLAVNDDFVITSDTLTIKASLLNELDCGDTYNFVLTSKGGSLEFFIKINAVSPTGNLNANKYGKFSDDPITYSYDLYNFPFVSLKQGENELIEGKHFLNSNNVITFFNSYLDSLNANRYEFTLISEGGSVSFELEVNNIYEEPELTKTTYYYTIDSYVDLTIKSYLGGDFKHTAVYENQTQLVLGSDYTFDNEYIVLSYTYLNNLSLGDHNMSFTTSVGSKNFVVKVEREVNAPTLTAQVSTIIYQSAEDDVVLNADLFGFEFKGLLCNNNPLTKDADYTLSFDAENKGTINLLKTFINNLACGRYTFTVISEAGSSGVSINIINSHKQPVVNPNSYDYKVGSGEEIVVSTDLDNASIISVSNNGVNLTEGDYTYTNSSLTLLPNYVRTLSNQTYIFTITTEGGSANFVVVGKQEFVAPSIDDAEKEYILHATPEQTNVIYDVDLHGLELTYLFVGQYQLTGEEYSLNNGVLTLNMKNGNLANLVVGKYTGKVLTLAGQGTFTLVIKDANTAPTTDGSYFEYEKGGVSGLLIYCDLGGFIDVHIKQGGIELTKNEDFTVDGHGTSFVIQSSYLNTLEYSKTYSFLLYTNAGETTFYVTILNPYKAPTVYPNIVHRQLSSTDDVVVDVNLSGANINSLVYNGSALISETDYVLVNNKLTVFNSFISKTLVSNGDYSFVINTDGGSTNFIISIADLPSTPSCLANYRVNKYPSNDFVLTSIVLNGYEIKSFTIGNLDMTNSYEVKGNTIIVKANILDQLETKTYDCIIVTENNNNDQYILRFTLEVNNPYIEPSIISCGLSYIMGTNPFIEVGVNADDAPFVGLFSGANELTRGVDYSYSETTHQIVIFNSYLLTLNQPQAYEFTFVNQSGKASFLINVYAQYVAPTIKTLSSTYDTSYKENVVIDLDLHQFDLLDISLKGVSLDKKSYILSTEKLVILSSFLDSLDYGDYLFTVFTKAGSSTFTIEVMNSINAPTADVTYFEFVKNSEGTISIDITMDEDDHILGVMFGDVILSKNLDYTIEESSITLLNSHLKPLDKNAYTYTICTLGGELKFVVMVKNGDEPVDIHQAPELISEAYIEFNQNTENIEDVQFDFEIFDETFVGVKFGDKMLIEGTDYTYNPTSHSVKFSKEDIKARQLGTYVYTYITTGGTCDFTIGVVYEQGQVLANGCVGEIDASSICILSIALLGIGICLYSKKKKEDF